MSKIIIFIVIIFFGAVAAFWYFNRPVSEEQSTTISEKESALQETISVTIKDFSFSPKDISIKRGTTVKWTNEDLVEHTATSQGNFDSGLLSNGQSFSYTFDESGVFDYICTPHPYMRGKITVE